MNRGFADRSILNTSEWIEYRDADISKGTTCTVLDWMIFLFPKIESKKKKAEEEYEL